MKFLYNIGHRRLDKDAKIEAVIQKFLKDVFGQKYYYLKIIEFLPKSSECFACQVEGVAIPKEKKIRLKYESFIDAYNEKSNTIDNQEVLGTLVHEMQHLINNEQYSTLFSLIKDSTDLGYVKCGMSNLLDECLASYWAFKIVPDSFSGILEYISKIPEDVFKKKANPYSLYLNIIIIIGNFIGETKAIYENSGVDEWSRRCQNIKDNQFLHILQLAKDAIESMEQPEEYLQKGRNVTIELLKYVGADFEFLKGVDEIEKQRSKI